jgi:hypothetical protein
MSLRGSSQGESSGAFEGAATRKLIEIGEDERFSFVDGLSPSLRDQFEQCSLW